MTIWIPSINTYDHISRAYGKAYRIARGSRPHVLCVILAKNFACVKWDLARSNKSNTMRNSQPHLRFGDLAFDEQAPKTQRETQKLLQWICSSRSGQQIDFWLCCHHRQHSKWTKIPQLRWGKQWPTRSISPSTHACESKATIQWW
jgi:hypothetical protein